MNITAIGLPAARFDSLASIETFRGEAERYEAAVAAYQADGEEAALWEALAGLGYDHEAIRWHIGRCGERMPQGYL
jgi:hypothetical protein